MVYVLQTTDRIKIGYTGNLVARMAAWRVGGLRFSLLGAVSGNEDVEKSLQWPIGQYRINLSDWFVRNESVDKYVSDLGLKHPHCFGISSDVGARLLTLNGPWPERFYGRPMEREKMLSLLYSACSKRRDVDRVVILECKRCGHDWCPRRGMRTATICPMCKSRRWDESDGSLSGVVPAAAEDGPATQVKQVDSVKGGPHYVKDDSTEWS